MSYRYTLQDLLAVLYSTAPTKADAVSVGRRRVEHGLLSVGLKLHYLGGLSPFNKIIEELGGHQEIVLVNGYRRQTATLCWVLPPVGNARTAIQLLECIELASQCPIFNNKDVQIQVCSPARLSQKSSGLLAIAFYLGSDVVRRYTLGDFGTTFSQFEKEKLDKYGRGRRLVLYDASGDFDSAFDWWGRREGTLSVNSWLPFSEGRTDMLAVTSKVDIHNINLVATLLCHVKHGGYWHSLGNRFVEEMMALLRRHMLEGLTAAPWVRSNEPIPDGDEQFISALKELTAYALEDIMRVNRLGRYSREKYNGPMGILWEIKSLLERYRSALVQESRRIKVSTGDIT